MMHQIRVTFIVDDMPLVRTGVWSVPRPGDVMKLVEGLDTGLGVPKTTSYTVKSVEHEVDPQAEAHRINVYVTPLLAKKTKEPS